jgi:amidase
MAVQGPMARHVRDLRLALSCMSSRDSRDPWWTPAPLQDLPQPKRAAVTFDPAGEGVDPNVAAAVQRAAEALRDAGYEVEEADPPSVAAARDTWVETVMTEVDAGFMPVLRQVGGADANTFLDTALSVVPPVSMGAYMALFARRNGIAREWAQFFDRYPVILGPVSCAQPFAVGADLTEEGVPLILKAMRLVVSCNLLGLPAAVVNAGVANGLPQGVQLIGDRYREDTALAAAEAIEDRLGVVTPIDPR